MTTYEYLSLFVEIEWQKRVVFLRIFSPILPLFFHSFFALKNRLFDMLEKKCRFLTKKTPIFSKKTAFFCVKMSELKIRHLQRRFFCLKTLRKSRFFRVKKVAVFSQNKSPFWQDKTASYSAETAIYFAKRAFYFLENEASGNQSLERNAQSTERRFQTGFLTWRSLSLVGVLAALVKLS